MKPTYAMLQVNYPLKDKIPTAQLYASIGHPELMADMHFQNTCAVRVSMALASVGVHIAPGNLTVKAGRLKGRRLEAGQARLSHFLLKQWGEPEKFDSGYHGFRGIAERRGVASFFHLNSANDAQGHIDMVEPANQGELKCASACYWSAAEVWFWPLK